MMKHSIIIPVCNEEDNVLPLLKEIQDVYKTRKEKYEVIFIDDGSTDTTREKLLALKKKHDFISVYSFRKNFGKSAALSTGFLKAQGDIIITMDGDLQDDPSQIPAMLDKLEEGYDLVSGWKKNRKDRAINVIQSRIFNAIITKTTGLRIHDINCGFKVYRSPVAKELKLYGQLYRFIPIIAHDKGFRVTECAVHHRKRKFGKSKYKWTKIFNGFFDLFTILFVTKFNSRPLNFFGPIGAISLGIGSVMLIDLIVQHFQGYNIGRRPLLTVSVLLILAGLQIILAGLLAELITSFNHKDETTPFVIEDDTPKARKRK